MLPNNLTTLVDVKRALREELRWGNLTPTARSELETFLWDRIDEASAFVESYLGRNVKNYQHVEFHSGKRIVLQNYPVISIVSVLYDSTRQWDSPDTLTIHEEYEADDQDKQRGIITLTFTAPLNSIKVTYRAGYSSFYIAPNYTLPFEESGQAKTAAISSGFYDAWSLADAIETAMTDAGTQTYTCSWDYVTQTFTISASSSWTRKPTTDSSIWTQIGFENDGSGTSQTSEFPVASIPADLKSAVTELVLWRYKYFDKDRVAVTSEARGEQSLTYNFVDIPAFVQRVLDKYRGFRVR